MEFQKYNFRLPNTIFSHIQQRRQILNKRKIWIYFTNYE